MTSIAWDGRYLAADTRTIHEHSFKEGKSFDASTLEWLEKKLDTNAWNFRNTYFKTVDGQLKIYVPKKKLFYRGERIRAMGISGKVDYLPEFANLPDGFDVVSPTSFLVDPTRKDGSFIFITEHRVVNWSNGTAERSDYMFIGSHDLDRFNSIGLGSIVELNGRFPVTNSMNFVNISCMMNTMQGGQMDVWDSYTGELTRVELLTFEEQMDLTNVVMRRLVKTHESAEELTEMYTMHKDAIGLLGGMGQSLYPSMYKLDELGKKTLNPEYKGEVRQLKKEAEEDEAKREERKIIVGSARTTNIRESIQTGMTAAQARARTKKALAAQQVPAKKVPAKKVARKTALK